METLNISTKAMKDLRSASVSCIRPVRCRRSPTIVFEVGSYGKDLDPEVQQLVRKVTLLRRVVAKHPKQVVKVKLIMEMYIRVNKKGMQTDQEATELDGRCMGPVGLLRQELHKIGATLDGKFCIRQEGETIIDMMSTPWQPIKDFIENAAKRSRMQKSINSRPFMGSSHKFDSVAFDQATKHRTDKDMNVIRYSTTGAHWSAKHLQEIGTK